ncbi:uncharacterized protein C3orf38 homolog [Saccostrea echinata]|uniref:uncharacterized protein C3orf38 homolog n=1 Tax=Saccostrea echinata TaxID=191078 RepID=UPI002A7FE724|nr:uncharacterized protein C3orf38 homolog [Saccostrea echinata]
MPISGTERSGCLNLLQLLKDWEIFSLADTVTKKQIDTARSKTEAVKAIISFSTSAEELLNRQKITRDVLFKHLVTNNINPSVNIRKPELIAEVLKLWRKDLQVQTYAPQSSLLPTQSSSVQPGTSQVLNAVKIESHANTTYSPTINYVVHNQYNMVNVNSSSSAGPPAQSNHELQTLGETFARWFFDALNSHNPSRGVPVQDFGPQHFLDDAELFLLKLGAVENREKCSGHQAVSDRFLGFVKGENLLFNPNCEHGGIMVDTNPHGLVVVLVCGTIHRENQCLGIFEQMFGLIKDPRFDNNYKIKISKMKLSATTVSQQPKLTDKSPEEIQDLAAVH